MKTIVKEWNNKGGSGIFVKDQHLSRVCKSCKVYHVEW
jgi:hypothetical protein